MLITSNDIDAEIDKREIDKKQIFHYLGYCDDCKPPSRVSSLIDEYSENVCHLIDPAYSYAIKNIEQVKGASVFIDGAIVLRSNVIARLLEECRQVALFVATAGKRLEEMSRHLAENGLILQSAVLDTIGSEAAERVVDSVQARIDDLATAQGYCTSPRFSPGYCDWNISQQKIIFKATNNDSTGVRLTEECLMIPRKSISGIIGIGQCSNNVKHYNPCIKCGKHDCQGRRVT